MYVFQKRTGFDAILQKHYLSVEFVFSNTKEGEIRESPEAKFFIAYKEISKHVISTDV